MHGLGLTNSKGGIIKRRHSFQLNHLNSTHAIFLQMSLISGLPYLKMQKALIFDSTKKAFLSAKGSTEKLNSATTLIHTYHPSVLLRGFVLAAFWWPPQPLEVQSPSKTPDWDGTKATWDLPTPILVDASLRKKEERKKQLRTCKLLTPVWLLSNRPSSATDAFWNTGVEWRPKIIKPWQWRDWPGEVPKPTSDNYNYTPYALFISPSSLRQTH